MNGERLRLMRVGPLDLAPLDSLAARLARRLRLSCDVLEETIDASFAHEPRRGQYHSTALLDVLARTHGDRGRLLAVTEHDLFVPILTFVYGEAQLGGPCAIVSMHRLREEFYGLPAREDVLQDRLEKEAVHELGHTFGLRHCMDWRCVMASNHAIDRVDLKSAGFCVACRKLIR